MGCYYDDIPIGKEHAITRAELADLWGVSDRKVRQIIADLRAEDNGDGYVIVAFSSRRGYYRTNDIREIKHFHFETTKRARNTFAPLRKSRRILRNTEGNNDERQVRWNL
jgi:hypothetical protein